MQRYILPNLIGMAGLLLVILAWQASVLPMASSQAVSAEVDYTGDGSTNRVINVGFKPKVVWVTTRDTTYGPSFVYYFLTDYAVGIPAGAGLYAVTTWRAGGYVTDTGVNVGFLVYDFYEWPWIPNANGVNYRLVALG